MYFIHKIDSNGGQLYQKSLNAYQNIKAFYNGNLAIVYSNPYQISLLDDEGNIRFSHESPSPLHSSIDILSDSRDDKLAFYHYDYNVIDHRIFYIFDQDGNEISQHRANQLMKYERYGYKYFILQQDNQFLLLKYGNNFHQLKQKELNIINHIDYKLFETEENFIFYYTHNEDRMNLIKFDQELNIVYNIILLSYMFSPLLFFYFIIQCLLYYLNDKGEKHGKFKISRRILSRI